ncbi:MAG: hypothetical protein WBK55_08110 [Alphaproteobacteria bacterium]
MLAASPLPPSRYYRDKVTKHILELRAVLSGDRVGKFIDHDAPAPTMITASLDEPWLDAIPDHGGQLEVWAC